MADLAATDVTITIEERYARGGTKQKRHRVKIAFGDGALTYPAAGVPLPAAGFFGLARSMDHLILIDTNDASGLMWKYDRENKKLRAWQGAAQTHGHDLVTITGAAGDANLEVETTAGPILRTQGAGYTFAEADVATKGGVASKTLAAGALVELGSVAVAAQVLYAEAVGW